MKFELKVYPSKNKEGNELREIIEKKTLYVSREEVIKKFNENDTEFYVTLREILYMFNSIHGFVTQISDGAMYEMYETVISDTSIKGIECIAIESECVSVDSEYKRSHNYQLDINYVRE